MPALSQAAAEFWNTIFNLILVTGAIGALVGTWGTFWTGNMKEAYTNQRVSDNEVQTATANAEAARANEGAAQANERAAVLEKEAAEARIRQAEAEKTALELRRSIQETRTATARIETGLAPRRVDQGAQDRIVRVLSASGFRSEITMVIIGGAEPDAYGRQIAGALIAGGVPVRIHGIGSVAITGVPSNQNPSTGVHLSPDAHPSVREAMIAAGISAPLSTAIPFGATISIGPKE